MQSILKYSMPGRPGIHKVLMRIGSTLVGVPRRRLNDPADSLFLYALVNSESGVCERQFLVVYTGEPLPDIGLVKYVGIVEVQAGTVLHIFECCTLNQRKMMRRTLAGKVLDSDD